MSQHHRALVLVGLGVSVPRPLNRIIVCAAPASADTSYIPKLHEPPECPFGVGAERLAQFLAGDPGPLTHQLIDLMRDRRHGIECLLPRLRPQQRPPPRGQRAAMLHWTAG
jgi:hypothetical protein